MPNLKQIYYNAMLVEEEDIPTPYTLICEFTFYKIDEDSILKKLSIHGIVNRNDENDLFKFKTTFDVELEINNIKDIKEYLEKGDTIFDDLLDRFSDLYDENIVYNAEISRFKEKILNVN